MAKDTVPLVLIFVEGGSVQEVKGNDNHYVVDWDNYVCPICYADLIQDRCEFCGIDYNAPYEKICEQIAAAKEKEPPF